MHAVSTGRRRARVLEVVFVVGEDVAAEARHGSKLIGGGEAPGLAVVAGAVEASLPGPARASQAVDAFEKRNTAGQRHRWTEVMEKH